MTMPPHSYTVSKIKCCVSECNSRNRNANFYKFPHSVLLVNIWKNALQISGSQAVIDYHVCEQHFDQRDFLSGTRTLRKLAIPSILRNDRKLNLQVVEENTGHCSCECTCGNRQGNTKSTNSNSLENVINPYSRPKETTHQTEPDRSTKDLPVLSSGDASFLQYSIDRFSGFEGSDFNKLVCLSDSEERTAVIAEETASNELLASSRVKLHDKISLMKKYKEMSKKFGTNKCLYCGYRDADVLYHIRRIHYGMFPEGPISDETIYEELIRQMESFEKEEEEFPTHYLNANYKMTCQYCDGDFPDVLALIIHVKDVHETTCGPLPLREDQLKCGMRNCSFCNRILINLEEYNLHATRCILNPASRGYKEQQICEVCGQTGSRDQMKAHRLRSHCNEDRDKFICEICGRALSSTTYYKYHLLRHENKRGLRCRIEGCNKFFNTPACLQNHHATHLSPEAWKFACNICGKRFRSRNFLLKHEDSHSMARYQCVECGKVLKGKFAMQVHVLRFHSSNSSGKRLFRIAPPTKKARSQLKGEGMCIAKGRSETKTSQDMNGDGLEKEEDIQSRAEYKNENQFYRNRVKN